MTIIVGSKNKAKLSAVRETLLDYPSLSAAEVISVPVSSGVSDQPLSLEETAQGSKNRAERAYLSGTTQNRLGIGLEGGLMPVPAMSGEYMNVSICSIYDGERHHIGMSCGFRIPLEVSRLIYEDGLNLTQAMLKSRFSDDPELGESGGAIGLFTNGRICRKKYCQQSLTTALISIENTHYFNAPLNQNTCPVH